ncbi:sensor domain-containing diguanylate cyclase [Massilia niastensis]|uniref:sensor domain-containing diguanylate cyclase n=1 Tax=Massilia niastensis TaxID=544911 RepID=UPI0003610455|nr:sensor domain-containing diguanylate cyclase [Massilia niastensis]
MPETFDPDISRLSAKKRPAVLFAFLFLASFCMVLAGIVGWDAWRARQERLAETTTATSNMSRALAAQAQTAISVVDTVLAGVVERIEHDGLDGARRARMSLHLRNMVGEVNELHGLFVYDAAGNWLVTSLGREVDGNNADREYFQHHLKHDDRKVYVGQPVRSRSSGIWILPVSRRLAHPDGSFAGVALATIRIDYFGKLYESFNIGKAGTIVLMRDNGTLLYRRPYDDALVGSDVTRGPIYQMYRRHGKAGTAMMRSYIDKVERLFSYRHLEDYPLIVATAQSKQEILADWWQSTLTRALLTAAVILMLCGFGSRLIRQIIIRDRLQVELTNARSALQQHNRELTVLADNDGLTGIANRRCFEQALQVERGRAARSGTPLSLVMLDVDFFKKYNDAYGHVAGDECLRQVAAAIRDSLGRPTDLAARYGGEEFGVLLPNTSAHGARQVAERIRSAVLAAGIAHAGNPPGLVTISAGVHTARFGPGQETDPTVLVGHADALLYQAKRNGRNQVCTDEDDAARRVPTAINS